MTTYNSYEEAKIAMPEACIVKYKHDGKYRFTGMPTREGTTLCNGSEFAEPADHCMTVEQFLNAGHEFVEGDVYLDDLGCVWTINKTVAEQFCYAPSKDDGDYYILRAAALKGKPNQYESVAKDLPKKRTKVEYVKCDYSKEWQAVRHYNEVGELFVVDCCGNYTNVNDMSGAWYEVVCKNYRNLYRSIETPIEWWEDAVDFAKQCKHVNTAVYLPEYESIDIDGSMTRDEACDFARILLEQGE